MNAIIFLAPISAFDQTLAENARVNRLEDSMLLWRSVVSNKLLQDVNIILFLNKCDMLEKKLRAGVRLAKYVKSFQERSNDSETVQKCAFFLFLLIFFFAFRLFSFFFLDCAFDIVFHYVFL